MEAYYDVITPRHRPAPLFIHQHEEPWNYEHVLQGIPMDRHDRPTVQHYQQELQYPSFTSRWIDDYRTRYNYPTVDTGSYTYYDPEMFSYTFQDPQRSSSPSNSGTSPSQFSESYSDRQSTPQSSPTPSLPNCSPYLGEDEIFPFGYGGQHNMNDEKPNVGAPCVAMHDVQKYADAQIDKDAFEDDHGAYYAPYIQEGYHPMQVNSESSEPVTPIPTTTTYAETQRSQTPNIRRRRPSAMRATSSPRNSSRVSKRPSDSKRSSSYHSKSASEKCNGYNHTNPNRAFPCSFATYGCPSTFGSKNEWKRHINTQHLRLGYWRCDLCDQEDRKPNDFNRKDLFIQHVRRMHPIEAKPKSLKAKPLSAKSAKNDPEEQELAAAATRCWRHIRAPPEESSCLFCDVKFNGSGTWDERLEHIGRHMEMAKKDSNETVEPQNWYQDTALEEWLVREEIIVDSKDGFILAEGGGA